MPTLFEEELLAGVVVIMIERMKKTVFEQAGVSVSMVEGKAAVTQNHGRSGVAVLIREVDRWVFVLNKRHTAAKLMVECVMGSREEGESFEDCAVREVAEETGYHIQKSQLESLGQIMPESSILDTLIRVFYVNVTGCEKGAIKDKEEVEQLFYFTNDYLTKEIQEDRLVHGPTLAALQKYYMTAKT